MPMVISKISRIEHVLNQYPTLAGVLGKVYTEYNRNWPGGSDVVVLGMRYVEVITALIIIMHIVTVLWCIYLYNNLT